MSLRLFTRVLALVLLTMMSAVLSAATSVGAAPGDWTATDVNNAVAKGVAYLDSQQNADGSFGVGFPPAETAFAIIAYGVLDKGDFHNLTPAMQTHLQSAVTYLLSQQNTDGSFGPAYQTYTTGLALDALSASTGVNAGIPAAISGGRTWLIMSQNAPPAVTGNPLSPDCSTTDMSGTDTYCGGWNYDAGFGRSDESNTGFALTGLFLTGGVPSATAGVNVGWQRHVQQLMATNYFATRNDGGGGYDPFGSFSSNANDTGSLLFGFGYDGVAGSDVKVQAALTFGTDVLDEYELTKGTANSGLGIYHFGMSEDGTCTIGASGCDWAVLGDGGFHYGLWSLTKGFGQYIPPDLTSSTNWYAKVVDLLLSQQNTDGSWPVDGRDDFSSIVATSFAVDALGLVGVPTHTLTVTKAGAGSGTVTSSPSGIDCGATCSASFTQGTTVTLTATPAAGSTFTGWSGACTGTGTCTVTMDQDRAVTATFDLVGLPPHTLTVTKAGTGSGTVTSSPAGIDCGSTCAVTFPGGTMVTLTATPAAGSTFTGWSGDCTGTGTCTVTMDQDRAVTATFELVSAQPARSAGYWKTHEAQTMALLPVTLGNFTVDRFATATAVFDSMNCGSQSAQNAVGCLAAQLLAAKLNVENGAGTCIAATIADADAFLISVGYTGPSGTYTLTSDQRDSAIQLKDTLDKYNNGLGC